MTCPDCSAWKARVEELERRLGVSRRLGAIGAVMERFEIGATKARILLRLYEAGGQYVSRDALMTVMSTESHDTLKTTMCQLRKDLPPGAIPVEQTGRAPGDGYRLSPSGMSQMMAALERPEFQETRG